MVMSCLVWVVTTIAAELHAGCRMSFQLSKGPRNLLQQCNFILTARYASGRVMAVAVV